LCADKDCLFLWMSFVGFSCVVCTSGAVPLFLAGFGRGACWFGNRCVG